MKSIFKILIFVVLFVSEGVSDDEIIDITSQKKCNKADTDCIKEEALKAALRGKFKNINRVQLWYSPEDKEYEYTVYWGKDADYNPKFYSFAKINDNKDYVIIVLFDGYKNLFYKKFKKVLFHEDVPFFGSPTPFLTKAQKDVLKQLEDKLNAQYKTGIYSVDFFNGNSFKEIAKLKGEVNLISEQIQEILDLSLDTPAGHFKMLAKLAGRFPGVGKLVARQLEIGSQVLESAQRLVDGQICKSIGITDKSDLIIELRCQYDFDKRCKQNTIKDITFIGLDANLQQLPENAVHSLDFAVDNYTSGTETGFWGDIKYHYSRIKIKADDLTTDFISLNNNNGYFKIHFEETDETGYLWKQSYDEYYPRDCQLFKNNKFTFDLR